MTGIQLDSEDIGAVLRSMLTAGFRGAFLPGLHPEKIPDSGRHALAKQAAAFFALPDGSARELENCPGWDGWVRLIRRACGESGFARLFFSTSGSTGTPRLWPFSRADFHKEVQSLRPFFNGRRRVVSVMPPHHVFGFTFALMLPKSLGIPTLQLPPIPTARFFRELQSGDLLLAFPVFWKALLKIRSSKDGPAFPGDLHGVSSAAPCPPEVIEGLLENEGGMRTGGLAQLTEIYGATEFGAVGIRRVCRGPYTLLPHWRRAPVWDGDGVFAEWGIRRVSGGVMPLPDAVQWDGDQLFTPVGRKDKAVQVGGQNVFPGKIATVLQEHPDVSECVVRLMRPEEGVRLKAFVVPRSGCALQSAALVKALKAWMPQRLSPAETPKAILVGEELPRTASGKPADWLIESAPHEGAS